MGKVIKAVAVFITVISIGFSIHGQSNLGFTESDNLNFSFDGALRMPTVGGFTNPQFSEIDLNQDGAQDLFVFDRAKNTWRTFLFNTTTSRYDYAPNYESQFPADLKDMVLLRDYNCDGHPDIFDFKTGGFRVHRCIAQNPWKFELATEAIISDYGSVVTEAFLLPGDVPAIIDIDFDGDMDILAFGNGDTENTLVLHENQSQDQYGNCDSLEFLVTTSCWGGFQEPPNSSTLEAIACRPEITPPINWQDHAARFHPGSTIFFDDVDADGDYDITLGDIQTTEFVFAENIGSASSPEIDVNTQTTDFPNSTNPVKMQYMTAAYGADIDHDGKRDLIATTNNRIDSSCNAGHVWSYRNVATNGSEYQLSEKSFLLQDMLDLGTGAVPLVFDVDGDNLNDLLVATDFFRSPAAFKSSRIYYFRNEGSSINPSFNLENDDYASISDFDFRAAVPTLGDIDGDGDQDMLIGDAAGNLHLFENNPSNGVASFTLVAPNYMGINSIGADAAPSFFDLSGDGVLDLVVGERIGTLSYFENTGTASNASFTSAPTISNFGKVDVSFFCCNGYAKPQIIERTEFGPEPYLFIGSDEKHVFIYTLGASLNDSFALLDSIGILADRIAPVFHDIDGDGIIELLIGTGEGGIKFYDRDENYPVSNTSVASNKKSWEVYPNPTDGAITLSGDFNTMHLIQILTVEGKICRDFNIMGNQPHLDLSGLNEGYYLLRVAGSVVNGQASIVIAPK